MEKTKIALLMESYNREDQVCTFIGSPGLVAADADKIKQLASKLSKPNRNMVFRSLHNRGAAGIFNEGILSYGGCKSGQRPWLFSFL